MDAAQTSAPDANRRGNSGSGRYTINQALVRTLTHITKQIENYSETGKSIKLNQDGNSRETHQLIFVL